MSEQRNGNPPTDDRPEGLEGREAERREALAKFAKWTAPAMLTLLLSERATADSLGLPPPPP